MKHIKFFILLCVMNSNLNFAQEFQGQATYQVKMTFNDLVISEEKSAKDDGRMEKIFAAMNEGMGDTYLLNFNKTQSTYEFQRKLETPGVQKLVVVSFGESGILYKDIKLKSYLKEIVSVDEKNFLLSDTLQNFKWQILSETKKIGSYNCIKAIMVKKVSQKDLDNYQKDLKEMEKQKTTFFKLQPPKERTTTAWFTNDIPIGHGPDLFYGLPGLILEMSYQSTTIFCTKVVLNAKEKIKITPPTKGKIMSKTAYDLREEKLYDSMKDSDGAIRIDFKN